MRMSAKTDRPPAQSGAGAAAADSSAALGQARSKPRVSLFIATACGLGYLPKAPGTWGSLLGIAIYLLVPAGPRRYVRVFGYSGLLWNSVVVSAAIALLIAVLGLWCAHRVARFEGLKDPQFVVIDEVSGQSLACLLALAPANWKYLLLGFILFRVFDIWKPFPARQAEALPGGWGIMADDWIAAIYAGLGLWLARALGL
jgi:phosphatidylglycerophosphatase A